MHTPRATHSASADGPPSTPTGREESALIDYWRQLDLVSPSDLVWDVNLVGAGGLGSSIGLAVIKMGCPRLHVFDPDRVEPHNLPNQLYRLADVDRPKAVALSAFLREFSPAEITAVEEKVVDRVLTGVVIAAVDSMASRRDIWENCVRYRLAVPLFIDTRMGGEVGRVLTVNPSNPSSVERYEATLFTDDEGAEDPCTAQATIYSTFGIAALVANQIKRFARDEPLVFDHIVDYSTSTLLADGDV
jgi:molybdopterin/thiamine biosynthesis adenylyltransferase